MLHRNQRGHKLQLRLDHRELRPQDGELQEWGVSHLGHLQGRGRGGGDRLEAGVLSKRETENRWERTIVTFFHEFIRKSTNNRMIAEKAALKNTLDFLLHQLFIVCS